MSTRFLRAAACAAVAALWLSTPARARAATYYTFKAAANGSYMCAENYGKDPLVANRAAAGTWEEFQVIKNTDGSVSLLSAISGKYVSADLNLGAKLIADRSAAQGWEKFRSISQADGTIALQAVANGRYVSADLNLGGVLVADRTAVGTWERFTLAPVGSTGTCTAAPTGLTASAVTSSSVTLSWTAPSAEADCSITGYRVYQNGAQVASVTGISGSVAGLTPSTSYSFTVAAADAAGVGSQSAALSVTTSSSSAAGNFPGRFAAPYVETWNETSVAGLASSTGHEFYTLAFVIADASGGCTATWNGWTPMSSKLYVSDVATLRARGGDAIASFGGASGTELGLACGSASELQAAYQSVINSLNLTWIDLDIEGAAISWQANSASIDRRNKALKALQAANPSLRVSYTLPVPPTGLDGDGVSLLKNALSNGVRVDVVNVMAMDYGACNVDMGQAAINAAAGTRSQLASIGMSAQVGVTPMIGVNDTACENFTLGNAQELVSYAQAHDYVALLAYWAIGADSGYHYLDLFKSFH